MMVSRDSTVGIYHDSTGGIPEREYQSVFRALMNRGWFVVACLGDGHCFRRAIAKMLGVEPASVNVMIQRVLEGALAEAGVGLNEDDAIDPDPHMGKEVEPSFYRYLKRFSYTNETVLDLLQERLAFIQVGSLN
jgi:hypothetical protein